MLNQAYNILLERNLRITSQRKDILQILYYSIGHHLEVESIYKMLASKGNKRIGLATVYRTMETFEEIGLVSRLAMEKSPAQYELVMHDTIMHHHLICLKCGQVQEIDDKITEELKGLVLKEKGFIVTSRPMKVYGYCEKCREELNS